jgi:YbbR domain-containing protein
MTWMFQNWQLKLLALVLSLGLFAAVAFQENPPTTATLTAAIEYDGLPSTKILVNSPTTQKVTVTGLAESLKITGSSNVSVHVEASKLKDGTQVVIGHPKVATPNVRSQDDQIPFTVTVDERQTIVVAVDARISYAEGWKPVADKIVVTPKQLTFVGAAAELKDIKAFVAPTSPIAATSADIPSLPIQIERNGRVIPLPADTIPPTTVDSALNASLHVEAVRPNQTRVVPVVVTTTGTPAAGYRITAISLEPLFVDISGSATDIASINNVSLAPISVDGVSATITRTIRLNNLPANISSTVSQVTVMITIQKNPVISPSPSPSP